MDILREDVTQLEAVIGLILGAAGLAVTLYFGRIPLKQYRERQSVDRFLRTRRFMKQATSGLRARAVVEHRLSIPEPEMPVIALPNWVLKQPLPIELLEFDLSPATDRAPNSSNDIYQSFRRYLPINASGERIARYHEAVSMFDAPKNWFDAVSYCIRAVRVSAGHGVTLSLGASRYWEGFDATQSLSHEAAHLYLKTSGRKITGKLRRSLGDPLDFTRRECPSGFATLTIRRGAAGATFYLHRRDERVATAQNRTSVVPAGEFQPSDDSRYATVQDLDIWRSIMREYAEEFLGLEEARVRRGAPIDYLHESPYKELEQAKRAGTVRLFVLGFGVEPLNWKFTIQTVCIFDDQVFDQIFSEMVPENAEGFFELQTLHRNNLLPFGGWPFDQETVEGYLSDEEPGSTSLLALALAWKHREALDLDYS